MLVHGVYAHSLTQLRGHRMTGLDVAKERLLEVACIITDGDLKPVDDGVSYVIKTEKAVLDAMGTW